MNRLITSPAAFSAICVLFQLRVLWGLWRRDLTPGDTSSYFVRAVEWYRSGSADVAWSPLYDSLYGSLLLFSQDAHMVTMLHRLVIALLAAGLMAALARRILPPLAAWVAAAWWAMLPVNFDTTYEVHLFSALFPLLALLLAARPDSARTRCAVLAVLTTCTLLQRNEYVIATGLMAVVCLTRELRSGAPRIKPYLAALTVPVLLTAFYAWRSPYKSFSELNAVMSIKHTLNICQVYAFGYQQRNPSYTESPWVHCDGLMQRTFGATDPTFFQALARNPLAMAEHMWWNVRLVPGGLELLLFSKLGFEDSPDYVPVERHRAAHAGLLLCLAVLVAGGLRIRREWESYWRARFKDHLLAIWMAGCLIATAAAVILTQRPRPSYLLGLSAVLILSVVIAACALLRGGRLQAISGSPRFPAAVIGVTFLLTPIYYNYNRFPYRPLREIVARTWPHREALNQRPLTLLTSGYPVETCYYVFRAHNGCVALAYITGMEPLMKQTGKTFAQLVDEYRPNVFFVDETLMEAPQIREWLITAPQRGWTRVASGPRWALLKSDGKPGTRQLVVP